MKRFEGGSAFLEAEPNPEKNPYAEANRELRNDVIPNMKDLSPELRKSAFDRMVLGPDFSLPEDVTIEPETQEIFDQLIGQIADVEERYGREIVAELAAFY